MKDQILEFIAKHPIALIPILLLLPFSFLARYRRMKRRTSHVNDAASKSMLVVGFVLAFLIIGGWLLFS